MLSEQKPDVKQRYPVPMGPNTYRIETKKMEKMMPNLVDDNDDKIWDAGIVSGSSILPVMEEWSEVTPAEINLYLVTWIPRCHTILSGISPEEFIRYLYILSASFPLAPGTLSG